MIDCNQHLHRALVRLAILAALIPGFLALASAQTASSKKPNGAKLLNGYNVVLVEPFTIENNQATKDFPAGEEANLQLNTIAGLRESRLFAQVSDFASNAAPADSTKEATPPPPRRVVLSGTVIGFTKGNSGARFMTWPLPVGVSKAKARFVFRDAETNQEILRFEPEAKFQATMSAGVATEKAQLSHVKGGLVDALVKEIKRNR